MELEEGLAPAVAEQEAEVDEAKAWYDSLASPVKAKLKATWFGAPSHSTPLGNSLSSKSFYSGIMGEMFFIWYFLGSANPMSSVDNTGPESTYNTPQMGSKVVGGQSFTSDSKYFYFGYFYC